jgi:hypothetical protein
MSAASNFTESKSATYWRRQVKQLPRITSDNRDEIDKQRKSRKRLEKKAKVAGILRRHYIIHRELPRSFRTFVVCCDVLREARDSMWRLYNQQWCGSQPWPKQIRYLEEELGQLEADNNERRLLRALRRLLPVKEPQYVAANRKFTLGLVWKGLQSDAHTFESCDDLTREVLVAAKNLWLLEYYHKGVWQPHPSSASIDGNDIVRIKPGAELPDV